MTKRPQPGPKLAELQHSVQKRSFESGPSSQNDCLTMAVFSQVSGRRKPLLLAEVPGSTIDAIEVPHGCQHFSG